MTLILKVTSIVVAKALKPSVNGDVQVVFCQAKFQMLEPFGILQEIIDKV